MLIVRSFPFAAVLISLLACLRPQWFTPLSGLVVPLLGVIMLGMGTTLSPADFATAVKRPKAVLTGMALQFLLMLCWRRGSVTRWRCRGNSSSAS